MSEPVQRHILHIDMDAFFAAIEQRDHPELRGKPVLVGGSPTERGVVSTASYEARKYGCHSAMPMSTAVRLCPQAVILPGSMKRYSQVSRQIFEIMERFTPLVEPVSVDEAFLDITGCEALFGSPVEIAQKIKTAIREELQLTASVGLAPNKFLAKIASDLKKPDGLVVVDPNRVQEFLDPLPVSRLWGAGKATLPKFEKLHLYTFADVRKLPLSEMQRHFGSTGEMFYQFVRGIDDRPVSIESETKSISSETTFPVDVEDLNHLRAVLLEQTDHIAGRLRRHQLLAKTVTIKLRRPDFGTITRSETLQAHTDHTDTLWKVISALFQKWADNQPFPVRLIGAGLSSLAPRQGQQLTLFDREETEKKQQLDQTVDQIRTKFGFTAITRGLTNLQKQKKDKPRP